MSGAPDVSDKTNRKKSLDELSPAARRALVEAQERRRLAAEKARSPQEVGGRGGLDPARYGDWEVKGIASDF